MRTLLTAGCLLALTGCAVIIAPNDDNFRVETAWGDSSSLQGNGQSASDPRAVGAVTGLDVNGAVQMDVRVGTAPTLTVEADSNLLPYIHTDVNGNNLKVWVERNLRSNNPIRVHYTTPQLADVNANGSGHMTIAGLHGGSFSIVSNGSRSTDLAGSVDRLNVRIHGSGGIDAAALNSTTADISLNSSGRMNLGQVRGDTLNVGVHGSGSLQASGTVRSLNVALHGSGGADLANLSSQQADLSTSGSGGIAVAVTQSLVAQSSGSGRITVYGNPAQRNVSGKNISVIP